MVSAVIDAIETKKFGGELSEGLIRDVVEGYTAGEVPDYQMASLLMAIFIQGMGYGETLALTRAMAESGETYSFPECVDKHSTGGVGDKVSLTALPIAAACGAPVAKLSGRGLGTTGGTIDKLESIPGFSCYLSEEQFRRQVEEVGLAIIEAGDLALRTRRSTPSATRLAPWTPCRSSEARSSPRRSRQAQGTFSTT
jgi:thymidine phosphorylase